MADIPEALSHKVTSSNEKHQQTRQHSYRQRIWEQFGENRGSVES
jgi:hypothetical protein